jgi:riboflavin kinase/FMN adenylyltransferase
MIYRSLADVPDDFGPCAITIGNFDGVHKGHWQIMQRVQAIARDKGWKAAVLTFDPHPSKLVAPDRAPRLLMLGRGIDEVLILPFTPEVSKLTPEEFVHQILAVKLKAHAVFVGDNFRFGNRAAGDARTMQELGNRYGFST